MRRSARSGRRRGRHRRLALLAPLLPLPAPVSMDVAHRLALPSAAHWLGQDEYGRDVLTRLLWGARVSLTVAAASSAIACVLGTALGVAGGFCGGVVEVLAVRAWTWCCAFRRCCWRCWW